MQRADPRALRRHSAQISHLAWRPCSPASRRSPSRASIRARSSSRPTCVAGLPAFTHRRASPTARCSEARERVRAAIQNSGLEFPMRRVTVNLAPAHLRKAGPGSTSRSPAPSSPRAASSRADRSTASPWSASSSLTGEVRPCRGVLAAALGARDAGMRGVLVAADRVREAQLVDGPGGVAGAARASLRALRAALGGGPRARRRTGRDGSAAVTRRRRTSPTSAGRRARSRRSRSPQPAATTCCSSARRARARRCSRGGCRRSSRRSRPTRRSRSRASTASPACAPTRASRTCARSARRTTPSRPRA